MHLEALEDVVQLLLAQVQAQRLQLCPQRIPPAVLACSTDIPSFIHYTLSNPQIRCIAADILWQPSSLPCLGISSTMRLKALQTAGLP